MRKTIPINTQESQERNGCAEHRRGDDHDRRTGGDGKPESGSV
jgi:hypothetical protein